MDNSHVALVALLMRQDGFEHYRCGEVSAPPNSHCPACLNLYARRLFSDRTLALGIKLESMAKILKCAGSDDMITLKTNDDSDSLTFMFESPSQDRISDFELRLMAIDSEHLGIPDTEYTATIK